MYQGPARQPLMIWRGDNSPAVKWKFPFALLGSQFKFLLFYNGQKLAEYPTTVDTVENIVSWNYTSTISMSLPKVGDLTYELQRVVPGGENRTYLTGSLRVAGNNGW